MCGMSYSGIWVGFVCILWSPVWGMELLTIPKPFIPGLNGQQIALFVAVKMNEQHTVEALLKTNAKAMIAAVDEYGLTALHWAAFYGHSRLVDLLLGYKAEAHVWGTGLHGVTPLHLAVGCGRILEDWLTHPDAPMYGDKIGNIESYRAVIEILLKHDADPCAGEEESAFCYACQAGVPEIVQLLLNSGDITAKTLKFGLNCAYLDSIKNDIRAAQKAKRKGLLCFCAVI